MKKKTNIQHLHLPALLGLVAVLSLSFGHSQKAEYDLESFTASYRAQETKQIEQWDQYPDTTEYKIARRLKDRLNKHGMQSPSLDILVEGLRNFRELLRTQTTVRLESEDGQSMDWEVSLDRYPQWIRPAFSLTSASYDIDVDRIAHHIHHFPFEEFPAPVHATTLGVHETDGGHRAETDVISESGYRLNPNVLAEMTATALSRSTNNVTVPIAQEHGVVHYIDPVTSERHSLGLIASGVSNFEGSKSGRIANVRKALHQHVHNAVVMPDEIYSFNDMLGGPVTQSRGWSLAKIIVDGARLELAPGGGICQASTTVYRAIVDAGLPIIDRKPHSMYVSYYEHGGVGMDATIFPGKQDLSFKNTTRHPIVIQAYTDDQLNAYVNMYGISDGREVELEGPYFSTTAPAGLMVEGKEGLRSMKRNEIVWIQHVAYPDGRKDANMIVSRYNHVPKYLHAKYAPDAEIVHAAAGNM